MTAANTTWFITGASSGFGNAFARYALSKGYNVVATARSTDKLAALTDEGGDRVLVTRLDVTKLGDAEAAVKAAIDRFGAIDVVINNAGYAIIGAAEETPEAELRALMETNFFGAAAVTLAVLPYLRERRKGAIVNISSMGGQMSFAGCSAYSASKFALEGYSEALAQELAPLGIKVLVVEPGAFRTALVSGGEKFMPVMDDYRDIVGGVREAMKAMDGTQAGDPIKAAAAIDIALAAEKTPLRLQLGADAIDAIKAHSESLIGDLEAWRPVGTDTQLD